MFSLDAMTRGQHAISTASLERSTGDLSCGSSASLASISTYGALERAGQTRKKRKRRSPGAKSKSSATTLEIGSATSEQFLNVNQHQREEAGVSFDLYHEGRPSSGPPLKEGQHQLGEFEHMRQPSTETTKSKLVRNKDDFVIRAHRGGPGDNNNRDGAPSSSDPTQTTKVGKFRYVVAALIILGVTLSAYATNTMYIAAIEMISNDVLQAGMTSLRAKHLSQDPLAKNKNAGAPGTCPVEATHQSPLARLIEQQLLTLMNASEISAHERQAMAADTLALHASIEERLAAGQLVDWSISERGYIFTAHNIGTILLAVPVSRLGLIYGSKTMLFWCIFLSSVRMLLLPTLAGYAPFWATFVFETAIGGIGGNIIILGYPISAAWLLPDEANFFVAINILSSMIGISATNFVSTQLLDIGLSWCWCFYLPGVLLLVLAAAWFVWGADRPEQSRFVSRAELELLQSNTIAKRNESELAHLQRQDRERQARRRAGNGEAQHGDGGGGGGCGELENDEHEILLAPSRKQKQPVCQCPERDAECPARTMTRKPNWTTIFTCPTISALILVAFANHWTTKNATLWPTFFSNILHLDSSTIGIMLGVKGVWALLFGTIFAIVTRKLIVNRPFGMSLTAYRRWNQAIAVLVYAISVALILFMDCELLANFAALCLQPLVSGFNSISVDQMPLDMSAEDSGLLVSVIRLVSIGDILALPVASYILSYAPNALAGDRHTWRIVWGLGLLTRLTTSLYFVLIAKSRPKSYSRLEPTGPCRTLTIPRRASSSSTSNSTTGDRYV